MYMYMMCCKQQLLAFIDLHARNPYIQRTCTSEQIGYNLSMLMVDYKDCEHTGQDVHS